ncbi:hypothetical protein GCM10010964_06770 [Caldovatus sediminis]|uniref:Uncharacterized protein n=1 Tax=Caldovatus sediminis TaxID=2041189 RepID=A0A8J3EB10_9PROT|nr:hypothetical protein [Caldovatus sediminis]GGG21212.1 hypothetical protein GCM10010964_06770 [Caldovatus sediminis]
MSSNLLALLRTEERQLLVELRATPTFQKLEAVRRVIGLYSGGGPDAEPPTEELLLGRVEAPGPAHDPAAARDSGPPPRNGAATAGDARVAAPPPSIAGAGPGEARLAPSAMGLPARAAPAMVTGATPPAPPANASDGVPGLSRAAVAEPSSDQAFRDGSKAVSAVRAALLAVTR